MSNTNLIPAASRPEETAREVFFAWERLRLVYNLVLSGIVIVVAGANLQNSNFLRSLLKPAVAANVCISVGPVIEGYFSLMGADRRIARWAIFLPGLLLACLLTSLFVLFDLMDAD